MLLGDTEDEADFRAGLRAWLRASLTGDDDPRGWAKALHEAGYAGLTWPAEFGGRGLPSGHQAIFAEECALAGAPDHVNVIGLNMVGPTLVRYGTDEQRRTLLPRILSGEAMFCQGFSEPGAGSDMAAIRTRAVRDGEHYVVDGEKVWSSYAHLADYCLLLARTEPGGAKHHGLSCFVLDMRARGVQTRPLRQLSGDADFNQIVLDGVIVPATALVGAPGDGWKVAMTTLAHERGTFGITLTTRLAVQLDRLLRLASDLGASGEPAARREIAELAVGLEALRYTGYRALAALERTGEPGPEASVLKLHWSRLNQRLAAVALDLLARHRDGLADRDAQLRFWLRQRLRSRANSIEGGTSEILRGIIAERVLALPRSR
ncbi:acyl-CoA dehydrogenase family protein [Dactylosporangium sp. CS-033363]|uniref:acyl-CoA dehydrogenase family protein n=1 Tax=Dactylosporangium sp. CS-033363 TaxID=3239935 RepID=UPI003D90FFE8